jgi:ubiquinone/menaquinone biosynthesis C-methylase UbiE
MSRKKPVFNPFADPEIVSGYEAWCQTKGKRTDRQEKALLKWLLSRFPDSHTILVVGCGTGHFTRWFAGLGLQTIGLDLSWPMLTDAKSRGSNHYILADALYLPFITGAFDLVTMVTTLAFLSNPESAV